MITNWRKSRNEPATGFLTATQAALLSQEGQSAQAKLEDEKRKADAERQKAAAPQPSSSPPATAAAPDSPSFDGAWASQLSCDASKSAAAYLIHFTLNIRNGEITGNYVSPAGSQMTFKGRIEPSGSAMIAVDGATGDPKYALGNAAAGSRISFQLATRFSGRNASGTRVAGRPCVISMTKL
ncbi:MAG: hypothetical protein FJX20_22185 [Alphaproteobacteria bacterium]|nr:hypothetical protein [Alphaproteobacteria bacterium]